VRELAAAYGEHPSFAGLALQLSPDGYAQLPGPEWGLDDATIARFERDTKVRLPGEGPQRFAQRAAALSYETAEGSGSGTGSGSSGGPRNSHSSIAAYGPS